MVESTQGPSGSATTRPRKAASRPAGPPNPVDDKPVKKAAVAELISYKGTSVEAELNKVSSTINAELAKENAEKEALEAAKKKARSETAKKEKN